MAGTTEAADRRRLVGGAAVCGPSETFLPCGSGTTTAWIVFQAREAMSAQMDGEAPGVSESLVEAHVQRCEGCQGWREAAFDVTRRTPMTGWASCWRLTMCTSRRGGRAGSAGGDGGKGCPVGGRRRRQPALTVPSLSDAASGGMAMDMHGMHELKVFDFALAVAFLVGAVRPRLASGLAWPCCAAAFGLVATSAVDIVSHRTFETHELRHLIAIGRRPPFVLGPRGTPTPRTRRFVGRAGTPSIRRGSRRPAVAPRGRSGVRPQTGGLAAMAQPPLPPQKAVRPELAISVVLPGTLTHGFRSATIHPDERKVFRVSLSKVRRGIGAAALFTLLAAGTASAT